MTRNDIFAGDRSLNGNHTVACALPTRGGVCDCWPIPSDSSPFARRGQAGGRGSTEVVFHDAANQSAGWPTDLRPPTR